jgi:hypothetical protein
VGGRRIGDLTQYLRFGDYPQSFSVAHFREESAERS